VDAGTIVIGTPTVMVGPHPLIAYAAVLANALKPKAKFASIIAPMAGHQSSGYHRRLIPNLKVEIIPPVICKASRAKLTIRPSKNSPKPSSRSIKTAALSSTFLVILAKAGIRYYSVHSVTIINKKVGIIIPTFFMAFSLLCKERRRREFNFNAGELLDETNGRYFFRFHRRLESGT